MRFRVPLSTIFACLLAAVLLAGCGTSGSGSAGASGHASEEAAERAEEAAAKREEAGEIAHARELLSAIESKKKEQAAEENSK